MSKGENIFKRKDGRWEARYIKGHELSGKIKYGFCYGKTYKEAKEKVTKRKADLLSGRTVPDSGSGHRLAFYCDEWLRMRKSRVKESTYIKYDTILERHVKPKLGGCFPAGITTGLIDDFSKELLFEEELSPKTVHDILSVLHGVIKYAAGLFPGAFPVVEINYPKSGKKEMRVLSHEEHRRFIAYLVEDMNPCKFGILLALFTGIRIGELCALRWGSISMKDKTINIAATLQRLRDTDMIGSNRTRIVIGTPKSETSVRTIPMTEYAAELCKQMYTQNTAAYVLTGTEDFMEPRVLQYRIEKYTRECGLEGVHCHTLRHTFATRAVEVGFEIKSLSEVLGHASTTITLDRYVHSSMELKRDNMNKLAAMGF
ncbi:MAG: tyrosine-type recombinase/integrase [Christensenellales bacterium]